MPRAGRGFSVRLWRGFYRLQTTQENVSENLGVAHAIETSNFDKLAPEDGLQAFVAVEAYGRLLDR